MGWDRMKRDGMGWDGIRWDGVGIGDVPLPRQGSAPAAGGLGDPVGNRKPLYHAAPGRVRERGVPDPSLLRASARVSRRTPQTGRPSPAIGSERGARQAGMLPPVEGGRPRAISGLLLADEVLAPSAGRMTRRMPIRPPLPKRGGCPGEARGAPQRDASGSALLRRGSETLG